MNSILPPSTCTKHQLITHVPPCKNSTIYIPPEHVVVTPVEPPSTALKYPPKQTPQVTWCDDDDDGDDDYVVVVVDDGDDDDYVDGGNDGDGNDDHDSPHLILNQLSTKRNTIMSLSNLVVALSMKTATKATDGIGGFCAKLLLICT